MRTNNNKIAIAIMTVALSSIIFAQTLQENIIFKPEAERSFTEAMKLFQAGKFDTAAALYVYTLREYPGSHRTTAALIMGGKAYYESRNYRESIRFLKDLIDLYPQSSYIDMKTRHLN
jgi:branched-chain amino acid transport system substrate-binding protein